MKDIDVRVFDLNHHFIAARIHDKEANLFWRTIFIYGEPARESRSKFFDLIIKKVSCTSGPLLCMRDWNCIWDRGDKVGGNHILNSCLRNVNRILFEGKLVDLGHFGP